MLFQWIDGRTNPKRDAQISIFRLQGRKIESKNLVDFQ